MRKVLGWIEETKQNSNQDSKSRSGKDNNKGNDANDNNNK